VTASHQAVRAQPAVSRKGRAAWRYGVYAVTPPPVMPPGMVTITPAGPLAATLTISQP
jgi:hypothetical protein